MKLGTSIDLWGLTNDRYRGIHKKSSRMSNLEFIKIAESAFFSYYFFMQIIVSIYSEYHTESFINLISVQKSYI